MLAPFYSPQCNYSTLAFIVVISCKEVMVFLGLAVYLFISQQDYSES